MGYITWHRLKVQGDKDNKILKEFLDTNDNHPLEYDGNDAQGEGKWYEHEKDMKEFSLKHTNTVFELHGEGEESGDKWVMYAMNGMSYTEWQPDWHPPKFDASKLKPDE